jgi:flagellar biosynthesis anti-sigma factor FlgM
MKISDLFGKVNNYSSGKVGGKNNANANADQAEGRYSNEEGSDRTTISQKAVLLSTVSRINSEDEVTRAQRVQALKQKVANGEYDVSADKVAKKISDYLFERA